MNEIDEIPNINTVSKRLISETETFHVPQLKKFFTPEKLSISDNKVMLGQSELKSFVNYARLGSFTNSFEAAFKNSDLLKVPSTRLAIQRVLREAANELPDARINDFVSKRNKIMKNTKLSEKVDTIKTAEDMKVYVDASPELSRMVNSVVKNAKRTGFIKMFGFSVAISAATFGLTQLYNYCVSEAQNGSGCFMYTKRGNEVTKCKIGYLSCKYANAKNLCNSLNCTDNKTGVTCLPDDNKTICSDKTQLCDKYCDSNNVDPNLKLADNQVLKCEEKKPAEVLGEAIAASADAIGSLISGGIGSLLKWGLIGLLIIVVITVVFKFVISPIFK